MAEIWYPSDLPGPREAPYSPVDRIESSGIAGAPPQERPRQRDRAATQQVDFFFTHEQLAIFMDWVENDLIQGGAWFNSRWFQPKGGVAVRRFIGYPSLPRVAAGIGWQVSATVQLRGRGDKPVVAAEPDAGPPTYLEFFGGDLVGGPGAWDGSFFLLPVVSPPLVTVSDTAGVSFSDDRLILSGGPGCSRTYGISPPVPHGGGMFVTYVVDPTMSTSMDHAVLLQGQGTNFIQMTSQNPSTVVVEDNHGVLGTYDYDPDLSGGGPIGFTLIVSPTSSDKANVSFLFNNVTMFSVSDVPWSQGRTFDAVALATNAAGDVAFMNFDVGATSAYAG